MIRLKGVSLEKSLELLRQNGIKLLSVERPSYMECILVMSIRDFKKIRYILRHRKVTLKILKKGSLFLQFKAVRKRKMLLLGAVLIVLLLFASTLFVWDVRIEGDLSLQGVVRTHLSEMGIGMGTMKQSVNAEEFNRTLLLEYPEIAWAQTQIVGTKLVVKVVGATKAPELLDERPANVIAVKDALIYSIAPLDGKAAVKEGQTVKKGDLLISGTMDHLDKMTRYVHARGIVMGRIWYCASVVDSVYTEERVHTGRESRQRWLCAGDWEMQIEAGEEYTNFDEEWTVSPLSSLLLPVKLVTRHMYEVSPKIVDRDMDQLKQQLGQQALEKALSQQEYEKILSTSIAYTELGGGLLKAEATLEVLEEIGETVPLTIPNTQEESTWSPAVMQR